MQIPEAEGASALFRNDDLLAFRFWLALPRARVLPSPLLLDASRLQHRALEGRGLVDGFGEVAGSARKAYQQEANRIQSIPT